MSALVIGLPHQDSVDCHRRVTAGLFEIRTIRTRITTYLFAGITQLRTEHSAEAKLLAKLDSEKGRPFSDKGMPAAFLDLSLTWKHYSCAGSLYEHIATYVPQVPLCTELVFHESVVIVHEMEHHLPGAAILEEGTILLCSSVAVQSVLHSTGLSIKLLKHTQSFSAEERCFSSFNIIIPVWPNLCCQARSPLNFFVRGTTGTSCLQCSQQHRFKQCLCLL